MKFLITYMHYKPKTTTKTSCCCLWFIFRYINQR